MTHTHLVRDDLLTPNALYGSIGALLALAGLLGYLFGRYFQQKIGVLALFAGLTLAFTHFALMTGEGSDKINGDRSDWGLAIGSAVAFALIAGQATVFLIMHDWASVVEIGLSLFTGIGLLVLTVAQYESGRIVFVIGVVLMQFVMLYLGLSNMTRFDIQGWIYAIASVVAKCGLIILWALSPNAFGVKNFSRAEFTWLYGGLLAAYAIGSSVYTWLFVEGEQNYRKRHNMPAHEHAAGAVDGTPLYVMPGMSSA